MDALGLHNISQWHRNPAARLPESTSHLSRAFELPESVFGICQKILTEELRMRNVTANLSPGSFMADQQDGAVCSELQQLSSEDKTFSFKAITNDESWFMFMT